LEEKRLLDEKRKAEEENLNVEEEKKFQELIASRCKNNSWSGIVGGTLEAWFFSKMFEDGKLYMNENGQLYLNINGKIKYK
jgi:hypothetical protein